MEEEYRSRPARGAWIEIFIGRKTWKKNIGRAPQGARGLKLEVGKIDILIMPSRPARGAWIEIVAALVALFAAGGRAPQGARGLKYLFRLVLVLHLAVAPRKGRVD